MPAKQKTTTKRNKLTDHPTVTFRPEAEVARLLDGVDDTMYKKSWLINMALLKAAPEIRKLVEDSRQMVRAAGEVADEIEEIRRK